MAATAFPRSFSGSGCIVSVCRIRVSRPGRSVKIIVSKLMPPLVLQRISGVFLCWERTVSLRPAAVFHCLCVFLSSCLAVSMSPCLASPLLLPILHTYEYQLSSAHSPPPPPCLVISVPSGLLVSLNMCLLMSHLPCLCVSAEPRADVTASILHDALEVAGSTLATLYGAQFVKLVRLISTRYLSRVQQVSWVTTGLHEHWVLGS